MAIKTISIFRGYYTSLQGYWNWDNTKGFVFVSRPRPNPESHPPLYTTSTRHYAPYLRVPSNSPSSPDTGETQITGCSRDVPTAELPNDTNNPDDESEDSSLDSSLCSIEFDPPERLSNVQESYGLGISGLSKKDGSGPFTGLGILSVHSSWQDTPTTSSELDAGKETATDEAISWTISDTMLQETLLTFGEDSFHGRSLEPIPEHESWHDTESLATLDAGCTSSAVLAQARVQGVFETTTFPSLASDHAETRSSPKPRIALTRDLTLPTISSDLKRVSSSCNMYAFPRGSRSRSCLYLPEFMTLGSVQYLDFRKRRCLSDPSPVRNVYIAASDSQESAYIRPRVVSATEKGVKGQCDRLRAARMSNGRELQPRWR